MELHKLLILSKEAEIYEKLIRQAELPGLTISSTDNPEIAKAIGAGCDLVFGEPGLLKLEVNDLPGLAWIQSSWAGVEPLLAPGLRRDYILSNIRNVYGSLMAEYVFGYLLVIERRILQRWQNQLQSKWENRPHGSLRGKILGLLGVGSIGSVVAATAKHFDMQVHGFTRESEGCAYVDRYFHGDELYSFNAGLDYLVCTLPGTAATRGMIDVRFLRSLPGKAWLINAGRGNIVRENDLVDALQMGIISGAVLDVFEEEPLPATHQLWSTPNTFITSHTAAQNYAPDIADVFIQNYKRLMRNEPVQFQVDFEAGY